VKNEIRVIGDKGKGNKTLCLCGDILTSCGNVLIHFLGPSYPKECLKDSSFCRYICYLAGSLNFVQFCVQLATSCFQHRLLVANTILLVYNRYFTKVECLA
jgi:hypothetical protein